MKKRNRILSVLLSAVLMGVTVTGVCVFTGAEESAASVLSAAEESAVSLAEAAESTDISTAESMEASLPDTEESEAADALEDTENHDGQEDSNEDGSVKVSRIRFAKDRQEIYDALKSVWNYYRYDDLYVLEDDMAFEAAAATGAETGVSSVADADVVGASGPDWTDTNVRTEGVDEADVVKTDGRYIYILRSHSDLTIVKADGAKLERMSTIHVADSSDWNHPGAREFFISDGILRVISMESSDEGGSDYYSSSAYVTKVQTFDVHDPASPVKTGELIQDGSYLQARMRGGYLYLFTRWWPYLGDGVSDSRLDAKAGGRVIEPSQVCIPDIVTDDSYLVVSSSDSVRPSEVKDSKVLISGAEQLYVSTEGIYAVNVDASRSRERSEIVKFRYGDGKITGQAAGTVRGTMNDTFSIDEYQGNLRILTTYMGSIRGNFLEVLSDLFGFDYDSGDRWTRHNALFVLDENLHMRGRIVDLAPGEDIRSARYFGNTAYFVTFRNTDPLFTVDLSDPARPVILGELKIPGFSQYLHPFGENLLLGLGYDADEQTGATIGVKLSIFDLTDPSAVFETDRTVLPGITWCPAFDDYKSIFADADNRLTGFFVDDRYLLYRLSEDGGFERVLLYDFFEDSLQGTSSYEDMRALRIGETFYLAGGSYVIAFDMADGYAKEAVLRLE